MSPEKREKAVRPKKLSARQLADMQFQYIGDTAAAFLRAGEPVISLNTAWKEDIGGTENGSAAKRRTNLSIPGTDSSYPVADLIRAEPGELLADDDTTGFIHLGNVRDMPSAAAKSILNWWERIGHPTYPEAKKLYIACDCDVSNDDFPGPWERTLQAISARDSLEIQVSYYPTGYCKWNNVIHRLIGYTVKDGPEKQAQADQYTVIELVGSASDNPKVICQKGPVSPDSSPAPDFRTITRASFSYPDPDKPWNYGIRPCNIPD